jgi:hypothetical protein
VAWRKPHAAWFDYFFAEGTDEAGRQMLEFDNQVGAKDTGLVERCSEAPRAARWSTAAADAHRAADRRLRDMVRAWMGLTPSAPSRIA